MHERAVGPEPGTVSVLCRLDRHRQWKKSIGRYPNTAGAEYTKLKAGACQVEDACHNQLTVRPECKSEEDH